MIILRIFLYLICIFSIGWSVLVFGGPTIIKRLISGYSDGVFTPSGVSVSPGLDISISRLEFNFQNEITGQNIEGFSRAAEIVWSLFGEKPLLEINLGPSVIKDYATTDKISFYTPSFQKIDLQNIAVVANVETLVLNSSAKAHFLTLNGNVNLETANVSDISIEAEKFSVDYGNSSYSASLIRSELNELDFDVPLSSQLFLSTFAIEDIVVSEPNLTAPEAIIEISVEERVRNFSIDLHDLKLLDLGGFIEHLKVGGSFDQLNVLQELQIDFADVILFSKAPKFPDISARIKKSGYEQYQATIEGNLKEFELSNSGNFIGFLPGGHFESDLELDREASKVISISRINFNTLREADIEGTIETGFSTKFFPNVGCAFLACKLSDFEFSYEISFDDEWVKGGAYCPESFCSLMEMDHSVRTSNTVNLFTILNQESILNPISSMYLYAVISGGQKINGGHELKF